MKHPYQKISIHLISDLQPRARDIVVRRFGFEDQEPQTLEAIGGVHGITRERARQIVDDSMRQVGEGIDNHKDKRIVRDIFRGFANSFKRAGHLRREDLLVEDLDGAKEKNYIIFLLTLGEHFAKQKETEDFHPFWTDKTEVVEHTPAVLKALLKYFKTKGKPMDMGEMKEVYGSGLPQAKVLRITSDMLPSFLEVSKHIVQGYDEKWGLKKWPEVNPRGVRDKAYMVLQRTGNPLHFTQVAQGISELQEMLPSDANRGVLPQTVHNELIKDSRFVLVGRGMYALVEWGYQPGTVKEVLSLILREYRSPMSKEEIVQKALEQRQVKESTILLNLQDKGYFTRDQYGKYYLA